MFLKNYIIYYHHSKKKKKQKRLVYKGFDCSVPKCVRPFRGVSTQNIGFATQQSCSGNETSFVESSYWILALIVSLYFVEGVSAVLGAVFKFHEVEAPVYVLQIRLPNVSVGATYGSYLFMFRNRNSEAFFGSVNPD